MPNLETLCAWTAYQEYFEYYAAECPDDWIELAKELFTEEQGAEECALIDWTYFLEKVKT